MQNVREYTGQLLIIERLPTSINGNPRYKATIDGWTCYTAPDAMLGYSITNHDGQQITALVGDYYGKRTIETLRGV